MTSGVLAIVPPPAVESPAVSLASMPLACGEVAEPCDPSDTTSSLIKGVWSMHIPETVCRMALNLERDDSLAFRAVYEAPAGNSTEIFPNNLDPAGHRKARRGVRYLRLIGVVLAAALD